MRFEKQRKERGHCLFISVVTAKPLKWFFARSSLSISSVSTEQWRKCATSWLAESLIVQNVHGNLLLRTIQELRLFLQNWWQRTNRLRPMWTSKETCRTITNKNSQIFQIIFNWPNYAHMYVSRRPWRGDSISRSSTMRNGKNWEAHVGSILFLEATHYPKWKDGFVGTRRSVQLWRWPSLIIKDVTESRSWYNLY